MMLFICFQLIFAEKKSPAATITEIQGTIEVERGEGWEPVAPLFPLFEGDKIRVNKEGKAVVMYLGGSPILLTEAISPYTINILSPGKSKKEKTGEKIAGLLNKILGKESKKSVDLVVRGDIDCSKTIQPNDSTILFPNEHIEFCWPSQQPPYSIKIFKGDLKSETECIYNESINDISHRVPIEIFEENSVYSWTLSSPLDDWDGSFTLKNKNDSVIILKEIDDILNEIPKDFILTRMILKSQFLIDYKLYYDANRIICESLSLYPDNEVLKMMLSTL